MSKRQRSYEEREAPPSNPPPNYGSWRGGQGLALATLGCVVVLLMISFANWREIDRIETNLDSRLAQIDNRIVEIAGKIGSAPAQAAPPAPRGPDPDKVYPIKVAGAATKGPDKAAVTIAEFSDFQ